MFTKSTVLLTLGAMATSVLGADLTISTPASLIQCQPALLSWSGGQAPYYLAVIPGGQPSGAALQDLGEQQGNSLTWTVNIASGTSITLKVTDSTGVVNYNQAVTIQAGSSSACLTAAATSSAGSVSTPAAVSTATAAAAATSGSAMSSMSMASASAMSSAGASSAGAASAAASKASSAAGSASAVASAARSSGASAASAAASAATTSARSGALSTKSVLNGAVVAIAAGVLGLALA
ncbi:hypothetical protein I302_105877 [Kwoniella bestiolae CBS 10118]|uniref:Uncharacterized protein n=1 Tax=Kwoniella bestiolae CBS 10118 TaxID=1296100 RepID=A0A1B9G2E1_9TREE|nr:hypothetical protein I302_05002 [Kwoniella bestiolae CBS 10118]OCF25189.1 hypothetical protein I302_05002 [Kwoniella bestiolae CBS 10118]